MRRTLLASLCLLPVLACSDDSPPVIDAAVVDAQIGLDGETDAPPAIDAPPSTIDAAPSTVVEVSCAGATIASDVTAPGFMYTITQPQILQNDVVRFTMPGFHSAVSGSPAGTDDGLFRVDFGQTKCLRFTATGTFGFWCNPHQFVGTLTVVAPVKRAP